MTFQNNLESIRNEFRKNQIYVPDQWLQDVSAEQQENVTLDNPNLNYDYFYRRWLETNLLELDYSSIDIPIQCSDYSLPSKMCTMNGTFQIVRVQDLAKPSPNDFCEALYMKAKDDTEASDEQSNNQQTNQRTFNAKHRQLYLKLFDGKKVLKAFEFETINQLTFQNCYPGAKVKIEGEIEQSLDILQLRPGNIVSLGGIKLTLIEDDRPDVELSTQNIHSGNINNRNNQNA